MCLLDAKTYVPLPTVVFQRYEEASITPHVISLRDLQHTASLSLLLQLLQPRAESKAIASSDERSTPRVASPAYSLIRSVGRYLNPRQLPHPGPSFYRSPARPLSTPWASATFKIWETEHQTQLILIIPMQYFKAYNKQHKVFRFARLAMFLRTFIIFTVGTIVYYVHR